MIVGEATGKTAWLKDIDATGCSPAKHRTTRLAEEPLNPNKIDKTVCEFAKSCVPRITRVRQSVKIMTESIESARQRGAITRAGLSELRPFRHFEDHKIDAVFVRQLMPNEALRRVFARIHAFSSALHNTVLQRDDKRRGHHPIGADG